MPDPVAHGRRRVHPATVILTTLRALPILGVAWLVLLGDAPVGAGWLVAGLAGLAVLLVAMSWLSWANLTFGFDDAGDFRIDSGVLQRRRRRLALSRLQAVDVVQPALARLVGMASVRIEVAGAGDSRAVVEYLPLAEAQRLRAEVLGRAAGAADGGAPQAPPEVPVLSVPTGRLIASLLLRGSTVLAAVLTLLAVAGVLVVAGPAGFLLFGFGVFVPAVGVLAEFATFYGFRVARSADGLRIASGLLSTTAQTVPPGRVHAVELSQSLLWRRRDWVRVSMNLAGSGSADQQGGSAPKVLLPIGTRAEAVALLAELLPQWDIAGLLADPSGLDPAPAAARRRAWLQHRSLGVAVGPTAMVARRGRFVERIAAVPHARVQSVRLVRGPWQRALGLATLRADTVPGPVRVLALHVEAGRARQLADLAAQRMHAAAMRDDPARWLAGGSQHGAAPPPGAAGRRADPGGPIPHSAGEAP